MTVAVVLCAIVVVAGFFAADRWLIPDGRGAGEDRWSNSVAVLPFLDFSPNKDQDYFCDGMTDAIIGKLSGVADLKVHP